MQMETCFNLMYMQLCSYFMYEGTGNGFEDVFGRENDDCSLIVWFDEIPVSSILLTFLFFFVNGS